VITLCYYEKEEDLTKFLEDKHFQVIKHEVVDKEIAAIVKHFSTLASYIVEEEKRAFSSEIYMVSNYNEVFRLAAISDKNYLYAVKVIYNAKPIEVGNQQQPLTINTSAPVPIDSDYLPSITGSHEFGGLVLLRDGVAPDIISLRGAIR